MRLGRMRMPNYRKMIEAHLNLIQTQVGDVTKRMLESTMKIHEEMLVKRQYDKARGYSSIITEELSLFRRTIETYITQNVKKLFETGADFSFSLDDIQKEKIAVFSWFDEICEKTKNFQEKLKSKDYEKIFESYRLLYEKIGYDQRPVDFVNTLIALQTEHVMHLTEESQTQFSNLFNNLNLHPIVKKASEKLFKDGHYAQAIFEACKALVKQVRAKSRLTTTSDSDLMGEAFRIEYTRNPLRVTRKPVLCLNTLSSLDEIDEQRGFWQLFMGTWTGIRDPKAHVDIVQKDPYKTLEYLSLISLLAKRTEEAVLSE